MRMSILAIAAASMLAGSAAGAAAEEVTLRFATTNPPQVHLNRQVLHPWAARINEQGKGVVRIDVRDGPTIANHLNYYDRVQSDVVQIAWGLQSVLASKMPRSQAVSLPFVVDDSETASTAFWRTYESGAFGADYDTVQPMFMIVFPQSGLHLRKEIKSWDRLDGLKVTTTSREISRLLEAFGAAPVSIVISEAYEALQRGTADGVVTPFTAFQPFKLAEVTKFHIEMPLGGAGAHVMMSRKKFDSLPARAREILMANSGEAQSRFMGAFWDRVYIEGKNNVIKAGGHEIVRLTAEQEAAWRKKAEAIAADWATSTPGGEKALATFQAELAKVKAGK